ncbi:MAG: hypothetical protein CR975_02205 [Gammaproteobacteria bacterium]|nr:MAG: hypothetical protein CR975_02205 [Gammaproteobacteria bacterium]
MKSFLDSVHGFLLLVVICYGFYLGFGDADYAWWEIVLICFILMIIISLPFAFLEKAFGLDNDNSKNATPYSDEEIESLLDDETFDYPYDDDPNGLWSDEHRRDFYEDLDESDLIVGNRYKLLYTDYYGNTTKRNIVLKSASHNKRGDLVLRAWCELRGDMRSFKVRNIEEMIDLETGELVV